MNIFRLIFPAVCILSLAACSGTLDKMGYIPPNPKRVDKEQSKVTDNNKSIFPEGYYGQNKQGIVLKPPSLMQPQVEYAPQAAVSGSDVVWNRIDNYDPHNFMPQKGPQRDPLADLAPIGAPQATLPQGRRYNDAVQVFSLDGQGFSGYAAAETDNGAVAQQIFFKHGSAAIKSEDKKKLHVLAKRTRKKGKNTRVTVVGHASSRVHRVRDPIKKKMINFKMAQKRANAVTKELHKAGLKPAWVQAVSKGDEEPNPNPGFMTQEAADRRAEVYMEER